MVGLHSQSFLFEVILCIREYPLKNCSIKCFHMTSRWPYWCPKTMKRRPCWCPKPVLLELNSLLMQTLSFVPINCIDAGHVSENILYKLTAASNGNERNLLTIIQKNSEKNGNIKFQIIVTFRL